MDRSDIKATDTGSHLGSARRVDERRCPNPDCTSELGDLIYMKKATPPGASVAGLVLVGQTEDLEGLLHDKILHASCGSCDYNCRVTTLDTLILLAEFAKLPATRPTRLVLYRKYSGRAPFVVHWQYWDDGEGWAPSQGFYSPEYMPALNEYRRRLAQALESFGHEEAWTRVEEGIYRREAKKHP